MASSPSPFRWVGSKARLLPILKEYLPPVCKDYYEPFAGGASLFFDYGYRCIGKAYLNDINYPLINAYEMLREVSVDVIETVKEWSDEDYSSIRTQFNERKFKRENEESWDYCDKITLACYFIALNHLCFNGVYRENKKGEFNVPLGTDSKKNPRTFDSLNFDKLEEASQKLNICDITLKSSSFWPWPFDTTPTKGDVEFIDSPYLNEFSSYDKSAFSQLDHVRLQSVAKDHAASGATVIVCGSNNDASRAIYGEPTKVVELSRTVGHSKRKKATECLWVYNGTK